MDTIDNGHTAEPLKDSKCLLFFIIGPHGIVDPVLLQTQLLHAERLKHITDLTYGIDMIADGDDLSTFTKSTLTAPGKRRRVIVCNDHFSARPQYPIPFRKSRLKIGD